MPEEKKEARVAGKVLSQPTNQKLAEKGLIEKALLSL